MSAPTTAMATLQQIVDARKVLAAVEAHARKAKRSMAAVRVLHGVLDEETLRLAEWQAHCDEALAVAGTPPELFRLDLEDHRPARLAATR